MEHVEVTEWVSDGGCSKEQLARLGVNIGVKLDKNGRERDGGRKRRLKKRLWRRKSQ